MQPQPKKLCSSGVACWKFPAGTRVSHWKVNSDNHGVLWLLGSTVVAQPDPLRRQREQALFARSLPCLA